MQSRTLAPPLPPGHARVGPEQRERHHRNDEPTPDFDPSGVAAISRRLSAATPPESRTNPGFRPQRGRSDQPAVERSDTAGMTNKPGFRPRRGRSERQPPLLPS